MFANRSRLTTRFRLSCVRIATKGHASSKALARIASVSSLKDAGLLRQCLRRRQEANGKQDGEHEPEHGGIPSVRTENRIDVRLLHLALPQTKSAPARSASGRFRLVTKVSPGCLPIKRDQTQFVRLARIPSDLDWQAAGLTRSPRRSTGFRRFAFSVADYFPVLNEHIHASGGQIKHDGATKRDKRAARNVHRALAEAKASVSLHQ